MDVNDFGNLQTSAANNVRAKTAMFESEAQRLQSEMDLKRQQMSRQKRSSSTPNRYSDFCTTTTEEEPIYIPKPDYNEYSNSITLTVGGPQQRCSQNQPNIPNGFYTQHNRISVGNGGIRGNCSNDSTDFRQNSYDSSNHPRKLNRFYNGMDNNDRISIAHNRYPIDEGINGLQLKSANRYKTMEGEKCCGEFNGLSESRPMNGGGLSRMNGYEINGVAKPDFPSNRYLSQPTLDKADLLANNGISYRQNFARRGL